MKSLKGVLLGTRKIRKVPALPSGTWALTITPDTIASSGGIVSEWVDALDPSRVYAATGNPTLDTSLGFSCVSLDGVNDRLDGVLESSADQPCTIWTVSKHAAQSSGRYWILEMSDTGATNRSVSAMEVFTNRTTSIAEVGDTANASYVYTATDLVVHRHDARLTDRTVVENGKVRASSCFPVTTTVAPTVARIGAALNASGFWQGLLGYVFVAFGSVTEADAERVDDWLTAKAGLPAVQRWPATVDAAAGDPRILLPEIIYAIVGQPVSIWKIGCTIRDGSSALIATSDLTVTTSRVDRWTVTPPTAGDYAFTVTEGIYSGTTTIRAIAALTGSAPIRRVLVIGDSNINRAGSGWIQLVGDALGSKIQFLGTQQNANYSYKHEGHDSYNFATYNGSGSPGASPLFNAGVLDWEWYRSQIAGTPDIIVFSALHNAVQGSTDLNVDQRANADLDELDTIMAAADLAFPGVTKVVWTPTAPTCMDPSVQTNESSRLQQHRNMHRGAEIVLSRYQGREAEGLRVHAPIIRIDPWRAYSTDGIHPNYSPGHVQLAAGALPNLVGLWQTSNVLRVVSATVSGTTNTQLTVVWAEAVMVPNVTGLSLAFTSGTARTITSVVSGSGTTTTVFGLSGAIGATAVFEFVIGAARTITAVTGGRAAAIDRVAVDLTDFDAIPIVLGAASWHHTDDAGASITTAGSAPVVVAQWSDAIGAHHLAEATARPTYVANFGDGTPAVDFLTTAAKHLETASLPVDINADFTIVMLLRYPSGSSGYPLSITYDGDNGQLGISIRVLSNTCNCLFRVAGSGAGDVTPTAPANSCPVDSWNVVVVRRTGTTLKVRSNGSTDATATISGTPSSAVNVMTVGGYKIQAGYGDSPHISREIQCYAAYLSDADLTTIRTDLQSRYPNVV